MKKLIKKISLLKFTKILIFVSALRQTIIIAEDNAYNYGGKIKEEMFYAKNSNLLNNDNKTDKIWYMQHTLDFDLSRNQGKEKYGYDVLQLKLNVRNKVRWGNPLSVARTTRANIKINDYVSQDHQHFIAKLIFWVREVYLRFSINALLNSEAESKHYITLGAFPFQLGRGIALGDAFAANPGILGFYSEDAVDQYAFGAQLSGDLVVDKLSYDAYFGLLANNGTSFRETSNKIRAQYLEQCDFRSGRLDPYRGPMELNYVLAARIKWKLFDSPILGKLEVEPYAMYNRDPEQRVEYSADANSKLGTSGMAIEWYGGKFEGGFDTAFNFGRQQVVSLDRNQVNLINDDGVATYVYSHILDGEPNDKNSKKAKQTSKIKSIVNTSSQNISDNGKQISDNPLLYNANDRFREGYKNKYRGWMVVADAGYWFIPDVLQGAVTAGVASGDQNPNNERIDGDYQGFIGLQEFYTGKRVKSAFVLSGRSVPRPLSISVLTTTSSRFASTISEFSNLIFSGFSFTWKPDSERKPKIMPNIIWFWNETRSSAFDRKNNRPSECLARRFLGAELNIFADIFLMDDLKGSLVASYFFTGPHYDDVKGEPLNSAQLAFLDRADKTGYIGDPEPLLGNDNAFTINLGLEYKF